MGGMSDFMSEIFSTTKGTIGKGSGALFDSIGNAFWK
jgi:hypothetical protein|tara:strand:+ start:509 stop:619 length:111 start_codon:yes stop_codon:yes gene_type:complete